MSVIGEWMWGRGGPLYWERMVAHKSNKDGPAIVLSNDRMIKSNDLERTWNEKVFFFFWGSILPFV